MKKSQTTSALYPPTLRQQSTILYPNKLRDYSPRKSHALRILTAVAAFIKLLESLFWLSLLLEATHNEDDKSGPSLTILLAAAFIISITTGLVSMFGPCFHGLIQFQVLLVSTVASFVWNMILLLLTFILDYYKHAGNEDNQAESAFNATIGIITAGAIFVTTNKLILQERRLQKWTHQKFELKAKPMA